MLERICENVVTESDEQSDDITNDSAPLSILGSFWWTDWWSFLAICGHLMVLMIQMENHLHITSAIIIILGKYYSLYKFSGNTLLSNSVMVAFLCQTRFTQPFNSVDKPHMFLLK